MKKYFELSFDADGSEIAELAIVMPLLFTLILGIYSFGRAYNIYSTVTRAAQDAARTAAAPACVSAPCALPCAAGTGSQFPCDTTVAQVVLDALKASNLDARRVSQLTLANSSQGGCPPPAAATPSCNASSGVYICRDVLLNNTGTAPACGTTVSFQYNYQFLPVPFIRMSSFNIPAQAQVTTEY
jgi:hypothetical protein